MASVLQEYSRMAKEYNSLYEVEQDLQKWFNYKDYIIQNKRDYKLEYWEWAIHEAQLKINYLHAARNQWIEGNNG